MRTSTQRKQETAYHTYLTYLIDIQELHTPSVPATTEAYDPLNQDLPLCFEQSRLAVALASSCVALAGQQQTPVPPQPPASTDSSKKTTCSLPVLKQAGVQLNI